MRKYFVIFMLLACSNLISSFSYSQISDTYEKALQQYNENNIQEAFIHLKNAIAEDPNHLPTKILMGKTLFAQGFARDALLEFQESLNKGADPNLLATDIAKIYLFLQEYEAVLDVSEQGLDNKNLFELTLVKASTVFNLNDDKLAESLYKKALSLRPNNERALQSIAYFYLYTERHLLVPQYIDKLEELGSSSHKTLHLKGQLASVNDNTQAALLLFRQAYEKAPNDPLIKRTLANMLIKTGALQEASKLVDEIIEQTPEDPFALILSAQLKETLNDDTALSIFNSLNQKLSNIPSQLKVERSELAFLQGLALYLSGNYEQSAMQLESYILKNKTNTNAISVLADTYIQLGNEGKALHLLDKNIPTIKSNLRLSLLLCRLYLNSNRAFKCEALIAGLNTQFGADNPNIVFMRVQTLKARNKPAEALALFKQFFNSENTPLFVYTLIDLYKDNGRYLDALERIDRLLKERPDLIKAMHVKSDLLIGLKKFTAAQGLIEQIIALEPESVQARKNLGIVYFNQQQFEKSLMTINEVLETNQNNFALLMLKGRNELAIGNYEQAFEAFVKAKGIKPSSPFPSELLVQLYKRTNQIDKAIFELDTLLRQFFLEPKYLLEKANLLIASTKENEAARVLSSLFGIWNEEPRQLITLSQIQRQANDNQGALLSLQTAQKLLPNSVTVKRELARVYLQQGNLKRAQKTVNELQQKHPLNPSVWLISGELSLAKDKNDEAFIYFEKASGLDSSYQVAVAKMYQLALKGTKAEAFQNKLERLIAQAPDNMFYKNLMADFHYGNDRFEPALFMYKKIIEQGNYVNMAFVLNNTANIFLNHLKDPLEAEKYAQQAYDINSDSPQIIDTLGWVKSNNGKYQEALTLLRQAFAKNSIDLHIRYHLAYTLFKLNRLKEANRELNYIRNSDAKNFNMQKANDLKKQISEASR